MSAWVYLVVVLVVLIVAAFYEGYMMGARRASRSRHPTARRPG